MKQLKLKIMTEQDLKILKEMLKLSKKLSEDYITFELLKEEIELRIKVVKSYL